MMGLSLFHSCVASLTKLFHTSPSIFASASASVSSQPSFSRLFTCATALVASSTKGLNSPLTLAPSWFLKPVHTLSKRSRLFWYSPSVSSASWLRITPMCSASSPSSRMPLVLASISGLSSCALLPNTSMASASRSVGFSISPRA